MSESARRATRGVILVLALAAIAAVLLTGYGGSADAVTGTGEPGDPRIDPRAVAVLEASEASFANSRSLQATHHMNAISDGVHRIERTDLRLARPNLFHITTRSSYAYEGPTSQDDPTPMRRTSSSNLVLASDGETKWSVRTMEGAPAYCTTSEMGPPNRMREVDSFNTIHWSFFDLGQWLVRSAIPGHWSTKWRLEDPGLRSIEYIGKNEVAGVPVDVVEWHYKIAYNYPEDDPLYKSRIFIGEDGFTRLIRTYTEGEGGSVWATGDMKEAVTEIREGGEADPADFAFAPPEDIDCQAVDPDHGLFDDMKSVRRLVEYNGVTHPILPDPSGVLDESGFGYLSLPQVYQDYNAYDGKHYIIDPEGKVAGAISKYGISIPMIREELKKFGIG